MKLLGEVATHVLTALSIGLLVWLARRPARIDPFDDTRVLAYPWAVRVVGWLGLLMAVGVCILAFGVEGVANARQAVIVVLFTLGFGSMGACLILDSTYTRVLLSDRSITALVPWRNPRTIAWEDVVRVRYSGAGSWFVIEGREGEKIRVSAFLTGIGTFAREIRARLPCSVYEEAQSGFATHHL